MDKNLGVKIYVAISLLLFIGSIFSLMGFSVYVVVTKQYTMFGLYLSRVLVFLCITGIILLVLPLAYPMKRSIKKEDGDLK
jgi:hypothetical protein